MHVHHAESFDAVQLGAPPRTYFVGVAGATGTPTSYAESSGSSGAGGSAGTSAPMPTRSEAIADGQVTEGEAPLFHAVDDPATTEVNEYLETMQWVNAEQDRLLGLLDGQMGQRSLSYDETGHLQVYDDGTPVWMGEAPTSDYLKLLRDLANSDVTLDELDSSIDTLREQGASSTVIAAQQAARDARAAQEQQVVDSVLHKTELLGALRAELVALESGVDPNAADDFLALRNLAGAMVNQFRDNDGFQYDTQWTGNDWQSVGDEWDFDDMVKTFAGKPDRVEELPWRQLKGGDDLLSWAKDLSDEERAAAGIDLGDGKRENISREMRDTIADAYVAELSKSDPIEAAKVHSRYQAASHLSEVMELYVVARDSVENSATFTHQVTSEIALVEQLIADEKAVLSPLTVTTLDATIAARATTVDSVTTEDPNAGDEGSTGTTGESTDTTEQTPEVDTDDTPIVHENEPPATDGEAGTDSAGTDTAGTADTGGGSESGSTDDEIGGSVPETDPVDTTPDTGGDTAGTASTAVEPGGSAPETDPHVETEPTETDPTDAPPTDPGPSTEEPPATDTPDAAVPPGSEPVATVTQPPVRDRNADGTTDPRPDSAARSDAAPGEGAMPGTPVEMQVASAPAAPAAATTSADGAPRPKPGSTTSVAGVPGESSPPPPGGATTASTTNTTTTTTTTTTSGYKAVDAVNGVDYSDPANMQRVAQLAQEYGLAPQGGLQFGADGTMYYTVEQGDSYRSISLESTRNGQLDDTFNYDWMLNNIMPANGNRAIDVGVMVVVPGRSLADIIRILDLPAPKTAVGAPPA